MNNSNCLKNCKIAGIFKAILNKFNAVKERFKILNNEKELKSVENKSLNIAYSGLIECLDKAKEVKKDDKNQYENSPFYLIHQFLYYNSSDKIKKKVTLYHTELNEYVEIEIDHYVIDYTTWELISKHNDNLNDLEPDPEFETLEFILNPDKTELTYPQCNCNEIASNEVIRDNYIDMNCDTSGSLLGETGETIYFYYIEDKEQLAIIKQHYYVL